MRRIAKIFQAITYWPFYLLLKFLVNYKVEGQENLKGLENKAVIFASNHASYIDGPISAASMPRNGFYPNNFFPIQFIVFHKYFNWIYLLVAFYVRVNGSIRVFKAKGDLDLALKDTVKALNEGSKIWVYPEGGLTKDGKLQQGKRGVAYLHKKTGAPIVPVALNGTFKILSLKTLLFKTNVNVRIGKPIYSLGDVSLEDGVDIVMKEIENLLN